MIAELQRSFGVDRLVEFRVGHGALPKVVLQSRGGAVAEVYLNGAQVMSWAPAPGHEVIFTSSRAQFQAGKSVRGGVPICFPQFGPGVLPSHGFARTAAWSVARTGLTPTGDPFVTLALADTPATLAIWPHRFGMELTVTLGAVLHMGIAVTNRGADPLPFCFAFHSYFRVGEISGVTLDGLEGLVFTDKVQGGATALEGRNAVTIDRFTDRVYHDAPAVVSVRDPVLGRTIRLEKRGLADVVVWNPWLDKTPSFADLGNDDWRHFVCVETGAVGAPIAVAPGMVATVEQTVSVAA